MAGLVQTLPDASVRSVRLPERRREAKEPAQFVRRKMGDAALLV